MFLLLVAVAACLFSSGGFGDGSLVVLTMASGLALMIGLWRHPARIAPALGAPVKALIGLCILAIASLLWTTIPLDESLRAALTSGTYAAIAISAFLFAASLKSRKMVIFWLVILAAAAALTGLYGVAVESSPWATLLGGRWRPGGFLEYPPALAFFQVAAMTALSRSIFGDKSSRSIAAAVCFVLGSGATFLTESRMGILAALVLLGLWIAEPRIILRVDRLHAVKISALWIVGGVLLAASLRVPEDLAIRIAFSTSVLAGSGWCALRLRNAGPSQLTIRGLSRRTKVVLVAGVSALAIVGATNGAVLQGDQSPEGRQLNRGVDHGRLALWEDSVPAITDAPLLGHGAGSFFSATMLEQSHPVRFAHNQILAASVETGVVGGLLVVFTIVSGLLVAFRRRLSTRAWLLIPAVVTYPLSWTFDWTWHLLGVGAAWAVMLGVMLATDPLDTQIGSRQPDERAYQ